MMKKVKIWNVMLWVELSLSLCVLLLILCSSLMCFKHEEVKLTADALTHTCLNEGYVSVRLNADVESQNLSAAHTHTHTRFSHAHDTTQHWSKQTNNHDKHTNRIKSERNLWRLTSGVNINHSVNLYVTGDLVEDFLWRNPWSRDLSWRIFCEKEKLHVFVFV